MKPGLIKRGLYNLIKSADSPPHPIYGRSLCLKIRRKTTISKRADLKVPISYEISSSASERKDKVMLPVCWNGLKHRCICALQYRQGARPTREKCVKVVSFPELS